VLVVDNEKRSDESCIGALTLWPLEQSDHLYNSHRFASRCLQPARLQVGLASSLRGKRLRCLRDLRAILGQRRAYPVPADGARTDASAMRGVESSEKVLASSLLLINGHRFLAVQVEPYRFP